MKTKSIGANLRCVAMVFVWLAAENPTLGLLHEVADAQAQSLTWTGQWQRIDSGRSEATANLGAAIGVLTLNELEVAEEGSVVKLVGRSPLKTITVAYRISTQSVVSNAPRSLTGSRPIELTSDDEATTIRVVVSINEMTIEVLRPVAPGTPTVRHRYVRATSPGIPGRSAVTPGDADGGAAGAGAGGMGAGTILAVIGSAGAIAAGAGVITADSGAGDPGCPISVSPTMIIAPHAGGSTPIAVSTCPSEDWTAVTNSPFLMVAPASGTGNGTVTVAVAPNPGMSERSGTVTIGGQLVTVNQGLGSTWRVQ